MSVKRAMTKAPNITADRYTRLLQEAGMLPRMCRGGKINHETSITARMDCQPPPPRMRISEAWRCVTRQ
ncbi:hypothetical protein RRG08_037851 [Elysia crispata]|uniref:Uncharacterized protein n=1 Tax=Elysia crispata TaxID=231223 RepID=A0AAE0ZJX1_9GAST|nr:hypothetical protein RRG08_037851 [Elysia crispata]